MSTFGVIVLAAGKSSRMGRTKQLLTIQGRTLVQHAAQVSLASGATEVLVVVGAEAEAVKESLDGLNVRTITNPKWEEGMGSSIAAGVGQISDSVETVVIVLCDQPLITADHLKKLAWEAKPVAASSYDGVKGAPCAFARSEFPKLLGLSGDQGAREIIRNTSTMTVPFDAGSFDVDTAQDYEALIKQLQTSDAR